MNILESGFKNALLVEDEPQLVVSLKVALKKLNILTEHATTIKQAKAILLRTSPEFILLDRRLPDGDGLEICPWLRNMGYRGAILVLTASGKTEDRIFGLNAGADDYLPKPFSWEELEARIQALARRKIQLTPSTENDSHLWQLDENALRVLGPKGWVILTPLEFKLTARLIQKPGTIISRNELLNKVWGFTLLPRTRTVDHFLGRLRKYFERDSDQPRHFLTIRGIGYKFQP